MNKINFVNNSAPALSAENLNQLQENVETAIDEADIREGGTMTGTLNTRSLIPITNDTDDLGSASKKYKNVYANHIVFGDNAISIKWELNNDNNWCLRFYVDGTLVKEL